MFELGAEVAGYRIEGVLGTGAMGTTYVVQNLQLPRREALKVISPELSRDPGFQAVFRQAVDAAAALDHPNIVHIYRRGEVDGLLWVAMELADAVVQPGEVPALTAIHMVDEVAKALDYAHGRGVVHGDIKPSNILLIQQRVLLADFGLARAITAPVDRAYAAPEVLRGQPADRRADVYSLGCTLYALLTGSAPVTRGPGMPAQPPEIRSLPVALNPVIATALSEDPARRFGSARELATAALSALSGVSSAPPQQPRWSANVSAQFGGPGYPAMPYGAVPHRTGPHSAGPYPTGPHSTYPPGRYPAPTPKRSRWRLITIIAVVNVIALACIVALVLRSPEPSAPSQPEAAVGPESLTDLLLSADQVGSVMHVPMKIVRDSTQLNNVDGTVDPSECTAAYRATQTRTLAGSGDLGVRVRLLDSTDQDVSPSVMLTLVAFPSDDAAQGFLEKIVGQWQACANRRVTVQSDTLTAYFTFGAVGTDENGTTTLLGTSEGMGASVAQTLTVRKNLLISAGTMMVDANVALTTELADKTAAKIPQ